MPTLSGGARRRAGPVSMLNALMLLSAGVEADGPEPTADNLAAVSGTGAGETDPIFDAG